MNGAGAARQLSVERRVQLTILSSGILVAFIGSVSVSLLAGLGRDVENLLTQDVSASLAMKDLEIGLLSARGLLSTPLSGLPGEPTLRALNRDMEAMHGLVRGQLALALAPDMRTRLADLDQDMQALLTRLHRELISAGKPDEATPETATGPVDVPTLRESIASLLEKTLPVERGQSLRFASSRTRAATANDAARQHLLLILILTLATVVLLSIFGPRGVSAPLRSVCRALLRAQKLDFDRTIRPEGGKELQEVGRALEGLLKTVKTFDALKTDRIQLELRKLETLANLTERGVMVCKPDGKAVTINNRFYEIVGFASQDLLKRRVQDSPLAPILVELLTSSMKDRTKLSQETVFYLAPSAEASTEQTLSISSGLIMDREDNLAYAVFVVEPKRLAAPEPAEKSGKPDTEALESGQGDEASSKPEA